MYCYKFCTLNYLLFRLYCIIYFYIVYITAHFYVFMYDFEKAIGLSVNSQSINRYTDYHLLEIQVHDRRLVQSK